MLLESQSSVGQFDFQLRLDVTGTIYMLYKTVPLPIEDVSIISRRFVSTFYLFILGTFRFVHRVVLSKYTHNVLRGTQ